LTKWARMRLVHGAVLGCAGLMLGCGSGVAAASSGSSAAAASAGRMIGARLATARAGRPLLAVSCSSPNACTAVGGVFAEHWNGRRWSGQSVPVPPFSEPSLDFLAGVSCADGRACLATGLDYPLVSANVDYDFSALAVAWDGVSWSGRNPGLRETRNGYLLGVSCPSASDCTTVGQQGTAAVAMGWHAGRWRVELAPVAPPVVSVLNAVSCTAATSCVAVGYTAPDQSALPTALVERWNGRVWSTMRTPKTPPSQSVSLNAVSCSRGSCVAVGSVGFGELVERWNGSQWSIQRTPAGAPFAELNGVSCVSTSNCVAVGSRTNSHQSIAERWNGSRWSIEDTPSLAGGSLLWAVSCPSAAGCFAVGTRGGLPLLERWNGASWSTQAPS
jgi:hypothetical protein